MRIFKQKKLLAIGCAIIANLSPINAQAGSIISMIATLSGVDSKTPAQWEAAINEATAGQAKSFQDAYANAGKGTADFSEMRLIMAADDWHTLAGLAKHAFDKADKSHLPFAPQDSEGSYYLELSSSDKAVNIATAIGNIPYSLDVLRYTMKAAQADRDLKAFAADNKITIPFLPSSKIISTKVSYADPLYYFQIDLVASDLASFETEMPWSQNTASWNHGGAWVGAQSIEFGSASNTVMSICGKPGILFKRFMIQDNGQWAGYATQFFVINNVNVPNDCQSGTINAAATSNATNQVWGDAMNFN